MSFCKASFGVNRIKKLPFSQQSSFWETSVWESDHPGIVFPGNVLSGKNHPGICYPANDSTAEKEFTQIVLQRSGWLWM